jgi:hypothetical protein
MNYLMKLSPFAHSTLDQIIFRKKRPGSQSLIFRLHYQDINLLCLGLPDVMATTVMLAGWDLGEIKLAHRLFTA